jgi:hypothetical protein
MRAAVITSATLFILGILFQLSTMASGLLPELLPVILSYLGLLAMLISFVLIVMVAVLVLFPGISVGLKPCQH